MKPRDRNSGADEVVTEIKVWMARRRLSQIELAERCGHEHSWVGKRLSGRVAVTLPDLFTFADALDVPIVEFFRVADTTPGQSIYYRKSA